MSLYSMSMAGLDSHMLNHFYFVLKITKALTVSPSANQTRDMCLDLDRYAREMRQKVRPFSRDVVKLTVHMIFKY